MMEKRNFVTSARTPSAGASGVSDIDDIIDAGAKVFGNRLSPSKDAFTKKASAEDEKSDLSDKA